MTLQEICEPIFLEICNFNRYAAELSDHDYDLRSNIKERFGAAEAEAQQDPLLNSLFAQMKKPLVYFVDDYVRMFSVFASRAGRRVPPSLALWENHILEAEWYDQAIGGEAFYTELDKTLEDHHPEAAERLQVFQTCLGLGFTGQYQSEPQRINDYLTRIRQRLARMNPDSVADPKAKISPGAYFATPTDLRVSPARWIWWVAGGFAIFAIGVFVFYFVEFHERNQLLANILNDINHGR